MFFLLASFPVKKSYQITKKNAASLWPRYNIESLTVINSLLYGLIIPVMRGLASEQNGDLSPIVHEYTNVNPGIVIQGIMV